MQDGREGVAFNILQDSRLSWGHIQRRVCPLVAQQPALLLQASSAALLRDSSEPSHQGHSVACHTGLKGLMNCFIMTSNKKVQQSSAGTHLLEVLFYNGHVGVELVVDSGLCDRFLQIVVKEQRVQDHLGE